MEIFFDKIEDNMRFAGSMVKAAHLEKDDIHIKQGQANFVTDYDVKIQEYLISSLHEILPSAGFYGEEDTIGNDHSLSGYVFYIDPIDGTTNFLFGYEHSCVSVGLALDSKMIAGFVYDPYKDKMYSAVRGEGSFLNGKRLHIPDVPLSSGIAAFGTALYNCEKTDFQFAVVKELFLRSLAVRNGGSAALDLCRIAAGNNVAYFEVLLQPYDYAAASIIIEEAGGTICRENGSPVLLNGPCMVLAGTRKTVTELKEIVNRVGE